MNKTLAISTAINLLCALRLPEMGVKKVVIGLQWSQFWRYTHDAVMYPKQHNSPVLLLKRDNYLAKILAGEGTKSKNPGTHIPFDVLENLPELVLKHQERYKKIYCSLKKAGVNVMIITYEELVNHFSQTMARVSEFGGLEEGGGRKGRGRGRGRWYEGFVKEHVVLVDRVGNMNKAKKFLMRYFPDFVCMLTEDCVYPEGFDCGPGHFFWKPKLKI